MGIVGRLAPGLLVEAEGLKMQQSMAQPGTACRALLTSVLFVAAAACGESETGSAGSNGTGGTASSESSSTGAGGGTSTAPASGDGGNGGGGATGTASNTGGGAQGSGAQGSGAQSGGAQGGGAAGNGGVGGLVSDPECVDENGVARSNCEDGSCVEVGSNDHGPVFQCAPTCTGDDDCEGDTECYFATYEFSPVCAPTRPECDVLAAEDNCACNGFHIGPVVLVSGEGEDCTVLDDEATACFWAYGGCLDACIYQFYRYDLGDGTALIMQTSAPDVSTGWVGLGSGPAPESCPVVDSYFNL